MKTHKKICNTSTFEKTLPPINTVYANQRTTFETEKTDIKKDFSTHLIAYKINIRMNWKEYIWGKVACAVIYGIFSSK